LHSCFRIWSYYVTRRIVICCLVFLVHVSFIRKKKSRFMRSPSCASASPPTLFNSCRVSLNLVWTLC
jgi:hypothetical protein